MSNTSTRVSSATDGIEVLYCGNISSDDYVWSVGCQVPGLIGLLEAPQQWVKDLRRLPGWEPNSHGYSLDPEAPRLNRHFTIQISKGDINGTNQRSVHVHGIDETGIIKVIVGRQAIREALELLLEAAATQLPDHAPLFEELRAELDRGDPRKAYWSLLLRVLQRYHSELDLINDPDCGAWFGHVQIYSLHWDVVGPLRHLWIAAYLFMRTVNQKGYVRDFLNRLPKGPGPGAAPTRVQASFEVTDARRAAFVYASAENTSDEMCDAIFGVNDPNDNGQGGLTSATTKNYRAPDPPPSPAPKSPGAAAGSTWLEGTRGRNSP